MKELLDWITASVAPRYPWIVPALVFVALAALAIYLVVGVIRFLTHGGEVELFRGLLRFKNDARVSALQDALRKLGEDSERKGKVIYLAKLIARDLADCLADNLDRDTALSFMREVLAGIPQVLESKSQHRMTVFLKPDKRDELVVLASCGHSENATRKMVLNVRSSCAGEAYSTGRVYNCRDTREDPKWTRLPSANHDYRSVVCVPIKVCGEVLGVLCVDAVEVDAFGKDDIARLELFADFLALLLLAPDLVLSVQEVASNDGESRKKA
ncbi:MAG: GAF domain-containing protein [Bacteroidota bacterium]